LASLKNRPRAAARASWQQGTTRGGWPMQVGRRGIACRAPSRDATAARPA